MLLESSFSTDAQVTAWETRFGTGGAKDRYINSLTRSPDGGLAYVNPRGALQLITQEHFRRQPKEELGWSLPENTSWEVREYTEPQVYSWSLLPAGSW